MIESTLRTTNNLLERLHASFFFYLLVGPAAFLKIGSYLPSAVLVGTAMLFGGLGEWVSSGWIRRTKDESPEEKKDPNSEEWISQSRPVLRVLGLMIATHLVGAAIFYVITQSFLTPYREVSGMPCLCRKC